MNKVHCLFISLFVFLSLTGCLGSSSEKQSSFSSSSSDIDLYTVSRNNFYGFEFMQPPSNIPTNAAVQIDTNTGGKKYIFADSSKVFSVITAYVNNGKLTRLTLGKSHTRGADADKFWHMILDKAKETYPRGIVVNSGIGAYIRFKNSPGEWNQEYLEFKRKNSMEPFNQGYHKYLSSIAFDLFAGKDRKIFVSVDYVTSAYQQARDSKTHYLNNRLDSI